MSEPCMSGGWIKFDEELRRKVVIGPGYKKTTRRKNLEKLPAVSPEDIENIIIRMYEHLYLDDEEFGVIMLETPRNNKANLLMKTLWQKPNLDWIEVYIEALHQEGVLLGLGK